MLAGFTHICWTHCEKADLAAFVVEEVLQLLERRVHAGGVVCGGAVPGTVKIWETLPVFAKILSARFRLHRSRYLQANTPVCSNVRDLHDLHTCAPLHTQHLQLFAAFFELFKLVKFPNI